MLQGGLYLVQVGVEGGCEVKVMKAMASRPIVAPELKLSPTSPDWLVGWKVGVKIGDDMIPKHQATMYGWRLFTESIFAARKARDYPRRKAVIK